MKKQFRFYAILICLVVTICIPFYNESYSFWREAISYLGGIHTFDEGNPNTVSMILFIVGFISIGITGMYIGILYFRDGWKRLSKGEVNTINNCGSVMTEDSSLDNRPIIIKSKGYYLNNIKGILAYIMGMGALLVAIPYSITPLHHVGAIMFVCGYAVLNIIMQEARGFVIWKDIYYNTTHRKWTLDRIIDLLVGLFLLGLIIFYVIVGGEYRFLYQKLILITAILSIFRLDEDDY